MSQTFTFWGGVKHGPNVSIICTFHCNEAGVCRLPPSPPPSLSPLLPPPSPSLPPLPLYPLLPSLRHSSLHSLSSNREHDCLGITGDRQDNQTMAFGHMTWPRCHNYHMLHNDCMILYKPITSHKSNISLGWRRVPKCCAVYKLACQWTCLVGKYSFIGTQLQKFFL